MNQLGYHDYLRQQHYCSETLLEESTDILNDAHADDAQSKEVIILNLFLASYYHLQMLLQPIKYNSLL